MAEQQAALTALAEERDAARAEADRARRQIDQFTHSTLSSAVPPGGRMAGGGIPTPAAGHPHAAGAAGTTPVTSAPVGGHLAGAAQASNGAPAPLGAPVPVNPPQQQAPGQDGRKVNGADREDPLFTGP